MKQICISIAGLPNAGKSTLLNACCNKKLSIISPKPHTTQVNIIASTRYKDNDIVFVDTPGMTKTGKKYWAIDANHYLFILDAHKKSHDSDIAAIETLCKILKENFAEANFTIVFNKIDMMYKERLLPLIDKFSKYTKSIFMISAKKHRGVDDLLDYLVKNSVSSEQYFEDTIKNDEFMILEMIREKIFQYTHKELPYHTTLKMELLSKETSEIHCSVVVSKHSHKKIIVGTRGFLIRKINEQASMDIAKLWGKEIDLTLFVKIAKKTNH